jgi:glycosyltransferase involved in cell wall biosynthesis
MNMKKKRIAFITEFIPPYRKTFYQKLLTNSNYEWKIIHGLKEKEDGRPGYQGLFGFENYPVRYKEGKMGPFNIRWQAGILEKIKNWCPDVVITQGIPSILSNWLAMDWAHRHNAKTITWHCGWEAQAGNRYSLPLKRWVASKYLTLVDHILAYSTKGAAYLSELQNGQAENITVCYNGLEVDSLLEKESEYRAKGQELRRERTGREKIFLYVGGMLAEKRVTLLLQAFHQLTEKDNAVLWLVGDGPDMQKVKELAETLGMKNVKFWGRVIEDVDVFFAAADYFVLPGIGGLALNQALFWGVPCVVSEADGTEDDLVFDGKTGFRFVPNDQQSLESALLKCLALPETERLDFGKVGRALVIKRSNVDEMVKIFNETIANLLLDS